MRINRARSYSRASNVGRALSFNGNGLRSGVDTKLEPDFVSPTGVFSFKKEYRVVVFHFCPLIFTTSAIWMPTISRFLMWACGLSIILIGIWRPWPKV